MHISHRSRFLAAVIGFKVTAIEKDSNRKRRLRFTEPLLATRSTNISSDVSQPLPFRELGFKFSEQPNIPRQQRREEKRLRLCSERFLRFFHDCCDRVAYDVYNAAAFQSTIKEDRLSTSLLRDLHGAQGVFPGWSDPFV